MKFLQLVLVLTVTVVWGGGGLAWADDVNLAVLGVEASEGAPNEVAAALTDALRQKVTSTKGWKLIPGRDLVDIKLVFSCPDEAPSCMAQAAKSLGASKLIFGNVKKANGDNFVVTLKLLNADKGVVDAWVAEQITRAQANSQSIRAPVQKWFGTLTGQGAAGIIRIKGDVPGAGVALDGVPSGVLGTDEMVIPGVTAGQHDILVSKSGYNQVKKTLTLAAGETATVAITMGPPPAARASAAPVPPAGSSPGAPAAENSGAATAPLSTAAEIDDQTQGSKAALRAATWGVLGAGLVGVVLGIKFALDVKATNDHLDDYRRYVCPTGKGICDSKGMPKSALTPSQQTYVKAEKAQGEKFQTLQWVSLGAGGVLIVTGGVLFYMGYVASDGPVAAGPSVDLFPIAFGEGGGGAGLNLRF